MAHWISDTFLFIIRLAVAWPFLKAGAIKLKDWETTLYLFEYEYKVPLLPFEWAAYIATIAEWVLPLTLILGLFTRLSALGLFGFNIVAVLSYPALWNGGFLDHQLWGWQLLTLIVFGGGRWCLMHNDVIRWTTNEADPPTP